MADVKFTVDAAKRAFFDRKAVTDAVDKGTRKKLSKFGAFVRTRARSSIRKRKKISEPGQPPSSHVGLLKKFILFAYDAPQKSVVIGPTLLRSTDGSIPETLEKGGTVIDRSRRRPRQLHYRARPYMAPAFRAELQGKLADQLKGMVSR